MEQLAESDLLEFESSEAVASRGNIIDAIDEPSIKDTNGHVLLVGAPICGTADPAIDSASDVRTILAFPLVAEIHAGLFRIEHPTNTLVPELVQTYSLSDDGTVYEFRLRNDLKFSDGSELTAFDVKWSWERALGKSTGTSRANDVFGSIDGAKLTSERDQHIAGVNVVDDEILTVRLTEPRSDFLFLLADPVAAILKRENVEQWPVSWDQFTSQIRSGVQLEDSQLPVGTGPFKLAIYDPDNELSKCALVRNEYYWGDPIKIDAVMTVPEAFEYSRLSGREAGKAETAFINGHIDYFLQGRSDNDGSSPPINHEVGTTIVAREAPRTWFLGFNPAHPPFDDIEFRRAVIAATNLAEFFPTADLGRNRLVPDTISHGTVHHTVIPFDVELAKQHILKSKYADSVDELSIVINAADTPTSIVHEFVRQWQENLGLRATYISAESQSAIPRNTSPSIRMIFISPQYPAPNAVLRKFSVILEDGEAADELTEILHMVAEASAEQDPIINARKYVEIENHILENALALPIQVYESEFDIRVQSWVHDLQFPLYGDSRFRKVWFDKHAPKRPIP